jgi:hypothetical protein
VTKADKTGDQQVPPLLRHPHSRRAPSRRKKISDDGVRLRQHDPSACWSFERPSNGPRQDSALTEPLANQFLAFRKKLLREGRHLDLFDHVLGGTKIEADIQDRFTVDDTWKQHGKAPTVTYRCAMIGDSLSTCASSVPAVTPRIKAVADAPRLDYCRRQGEQPADFDRRSSLRNQAPRLARPLHAQTS